MAGTRLAEATRVLLLVALTVMIAALLLGCANTGDDGERRNDPEVGIQDRDQDQTNRP